MYALMEISHADILEVFEGQYEAQAALDHLVQEDPDEASNLAIVEVDAETGMAVGEAIRSDHGAHQLF